MTTAQRILLRVISALLALVLIAGCGLIVGQVVVGLTGGGDFLVPTARWYDALRSTPWNDADVMYAGIGLMVVGTLLIVIARLTRPRLITLAEPVEHVQVVIPPRAVAQMLRRQAETVPGVATVNAEVTGDLARINATAPMADPDQVEQELVQTLTHALKKIPWERMPRLEIELLGAPPHAPEPTSSDLGAPAQQRPPGPPDETNRAVLGQRTPGGQR